MNETELTLEQRTRTFDWKEWIPIYGVYKAIEKEEAGRPSFSVNLNHHQFIFWGWSAYQFSAYASVTLGIFQGVPKIIDYLVKRGYF